MRNKTHTQQTKNEQKGGRERERAKEMKIEKFRCFGRPHDTPMIQMKFHNEIASSPEKLIRNKTKLYFVCNHKNTHQNEQHYAKTVAKTIKFSMEKACARAKQSQN